MGINEVFLGFQAVIDRWKKLAPLWEDFVQVLKSSKRKADVNEEEPSKKKPRWASEDASPPLGKTKKKRTPKPKRRHPR